MEGILSLGKIWTVPFHSASPREMEHSKFYLAIIFLPFHSEPLNICILVVSAVPTEETHASYATSRVFKGAFELGIPLASPLQSTGIFCRGTKVKTGRPLETEAMASSVALL